MRPSPARLVADPLVTEKMQMKACAGEQVRSISAKISADRILFDDSDDSLFGSYDFHPELGFSGFGDKFY
ncbi:hypothetical protein NL676_036062 [Syzygium grande]|nr:hypothetical protein NL676_036062 [Syzygium grande]